MNKKLMIKKIMKEIEDYVKPANYYLQCKGCIAGLAENIYELIEKEIKNGK
jgi:hypothetical protein